MDWRPPEDVADARRIQEQLRGRLVLEGGPSPRSVEAIAGVDASITVDKLHMIGAVVLMSWPALEVLEVAVATDRVVFPYVPGYLSFREIPVLLAAAEKLSRSPDLVIVDGQGIAHPRRMGLAAHLGLVTGLPTVGCAKSRLVGRCEEPARDKGSWTPCYDGSERIGSLLRTRAAVKPVWVSPGHGVGQRQAREWVLRTAERYRLPEPVRAAHRAAGSRRRGEQRGRG
jgi:deoxyribonuclease V